MIWQVALSERAQKTSDAVGFGIGILHAFVIEAETLENTLVRARERGLLHAPIVPSDDQPAAGLDDANEFAARRIRLEPVKGLSGGDKVHADVIKSCGFGGAFDAGEAVIRGEIFFAGLTHFSVGV